MSKRKTKFKLLIINPSPRKIKPFEIKIKLLNQKYDILREKNNFVEKEAYNNLRDFFLKHKEYTHLAILPDDLLVEVEQVDQLVADVKKFDYAVHSGICNFALSTRRFINCMTAIEYRKYGAVEKLRKTGRFDWIADMLWRDRLEEIREEMKTKPNRIIQVALSNFPFTIIRRDVVEKIPFDANLMGVDTVFFQECIKNQIPTYANLDVEMLHLKGIEDNHDTDHLIQWAFNEGIDTKVSYTASNPPKQEQIFLPVIQQSEG